MIAERLTKIRQIMADHNVDYYFVPSVDPHRNEYVPAHWQRRAYMSNFTGSAGDVLIGRERAYLWTDPRYFLQADLELDKNLYELIKLGQGEAPNLSQWLAQQENGFTFAVDPKVINPTLAKALESVTLTKEAKILYPENNWVDQIWQDQPPLPKKPILLHDIHCAGQPVAEKLQLVRKQFNQQGANSLILNSLEAICYLLNIRGNDIAYNPLLIANAIVEKDKVTLFVDPEKLTEKTTAYFKKENIQTAPYTAFKQALATLTNTVMLDPLTSNHWIEQQLKTDALLADSPITLMKAIKNKTEQQGMQEAHIEDAVAVIKFLHWLETHWEQGITELSAQNKLEAFRRENPLCLDLSFNTISGFGPHGAIIHYASSKKTDTPINDSSLYLVDSGGQYPMGTTDITRTVHLGQPTEQQRHHYTLVLKGHLAISHLVFPKGTCGEDINAFAHAPLWREGLDYGHGTGHGVGCYSCVHQFPPVISARRSNWPLQPGMVVSNEPGVYLEGNYGIRIENLVLVVDAKLTSPTQHGPFYCFKELTLVPYARNLIEKESLTEEEIKQIDQYHRQIYTTLSKRIKNSSVLDWLKQATLPL